MTHICRATSDIIIDNIIIGYYENVSKSQKYSWRNIEKYARTTVGIQWETHANYLVLWID